MHKHLHVEREALRLVILVLEPKDPNEHYEARHRHCLVQTHPTTHQQKETTEKKYERALEVNVFLVLDSKQRKNSPPEN